MQNRIFITGVGRSGTTLIQSILNAHPDIAICPETHFIRKYLVGHEKHEPVTQELLEKLGDDSDFLRLGINAEALEYLASSNETRLTFYDAILDVYRERVGKLYIGEKDPSFCDIVHDLHEGFPDAYLINIIRDPRDVIVSRGKSGWGNNIPFREHVERYRKDIAYICYQGKQRFGDRYIEIFYEDLLEDSEAAVRELCEKMHIDYVASMLKYYEKSGDIVFDDEKGWKQNVFKPIMKDNSNKWAKALSANQVRLIEKRCEYAFTQFRYKKHRSQDPLSLCSSAINPALSAFSIFRRKIFRRIGLSQ